MKVCSAEFRKTRPESERPMPEKSLLFPFRPMRPPLRLLLSLIMAVPFIVLFLALSPSDVRPSPKSDDEIYADDTPPQAPAKSETDQKPKSAKKDAAKDKSKSVTKKEEKKKAQDGDKSTDSKKIKDEKKDKDKGGNKAGKKNDKKVTDASPDTGANKTASKPDAPEKDPKNSGATDARTSPVTKDAPGKSQKIKSDKIEKTEKSDTKKAKDKTAKKEKSDGKRGKNEDGAKNEAAPARFKLDGGLTLEDKKSSKPSEKIRELASELKQSYEKQQKAKNKKPNRYLIDIPKSYLDIDTDIASKIMARVNIKSLSMFKTLYLPHVKVGKIKKAERGATGVKNDLDGRTKMCLFIVGNFVNEVIEKYDTGTITKNHKSFPQWINDGAQLLAFGNIYSMKLPVGEKGAKKGKEKNGIIPLSVARKLLRALIEVESSATQMKGGKVYTSINMSTYPREGSYVIGFMQESVDDFARGVNLFDPEVNVKYTCRKLHKLLVKYGGSMDKMLRAYNAGEGNMDCAQGHRYSEKVLSRMSHY